MKNKVLNHHINRRFLIVFFAQLFAIITMANVANAQAESLLSAKSKARVFEKVWKLIDESYYDPKMNGVNWDSQKDIYQPLVTEIQTDEEFYDTLKKMVGEMKDAHTRFLTPREAKEYRAKKGTSVGILLSKVEGKTVVEKVRSTAKGELSKVRPGMTVRTIGGVGIEQKLLEAKIAVGGSSSNRASEIMAYREVLDGEPNTSVKIGLTDEKGSEFQVTLVRELIDQTSKIISQKRDSGVGYIAVSSFRSPISDKFKNALIELKDTPSLIIDLRYNGGGNISEVLRMAGYLLNEKRTFGKFMRRADKTRQEFRSFSAGKKGKQIYSNPVIVLTSKFSASGSELFSSSLQEFGRAKIIGTRTCGCLLGVSKQHRLVGGSELHISDVGFLSSQGKVYEKIGVTPDKIIELKIADLQGGFDRGIAEAEKMSGSSMTDF